jgi:aminoglycoside 3-N-acetyltransferase I
MEIKKLDKNEISDFRNLIEIFKDVFGNTGQIPGNDHLGRLLSNPDFMVFVVKINGKVAGGLTVYVLHSYYSVKSTAYIYDAGITPGFQGQGLGKALISGVCSFCKQHNFEDAYVEAESDDIDAVNFYRKTNFSHEMDAKHFTYLFNSNG